MHFFFHSVLQFIYVISWIVMALWFVHYQFNAYVWMIRSGVPINLGLTKPIVMKGIAMTLLAMTYTKILLLIGWTDMAAVVYTSAPFGIIMLAALDCNLDAIRVYDCRKCLSTSEV